MNYDANNSIHINNAISIADATSSPVAALHVPSPVTTPHPQQQHHLQPHSIPPPLSVSLRPSVVQQDPTNFPTNITPLPISTTTTTPPPPISSHAAMLPLTNPGLTHHHDSTSGHLYPSFQLPSHPHHHHYPHPVHPHVLPSHPAVTTTTTATTTLSPLPSSSIAATANVPTIPMSPPLPPTSSGPTPSLSDPFSAEADAMLRALEEALRARRVHNVPSLGVRTPVEELPECENPLEKDGRNTVIRGRLPADNLFSVASQDLGLRLVSPQYAPLSSSEHAISPRERVRLFLLDCNAVYRHLKGSDVKVPIIGGGPLDLFQLQREVLLLGGLHNVVDKRAFRIIAQQLELPATCTSAAYVLKGTYERFLYHYEQLLVFGSWPKDARQTVNMKSLITQQRERAKHQTIQPRQQEQLSHSHHQQEQPKREYNEKPVFNHYIVNTSTTTTTKNNNTNNNFNSLAMTNISSHSTHNDYTPFNLSPIAHSRHRPPSTPISSNANPSPTVVANHHNTTNNNDASSAKSSAIVCNLFTHLTTGSPPPPPNQHPHFPHHVSSNARNGQDGDDGHDFTLPRWALELPGDDAYDALMRAACNVEKRGQARTRAEIVMLAVVECFEIEESTYGRFSSMGLARMICALKSDIRHGRRAQSVMFTLLLKLTAVGVRHQQIHRMPSRPRAILAENSSGEALLDGIFGILHDFHRKYLQPDEDDDYIGERPLAKESNGSGNTSKKSGNEELKQKEVEDRSDVDVDIDLNVEDINQKKDGKDQMIEKESKEKEKDEKEKEGKEQDEKENSKRCENEIAKNVLNNEKESDEVMRKQNKIGMDVKDAKETVLEDKNELQDVNNVDTSDRIEENETKESQQKETKQKEIEKKKENEDESEQKMVNDGNTTEKKEERKDHRNEDKGASNNKQEGATSAQEKEYYAADREMGGGSIKKTCDAVDEDTTKTKGSTDTKPSTTISNDAEAPDLVEMETKENSNSPATSCEVISTPVTPISTATPLVAVPAPTSVPTPPVTSSPPPKPNPKHVEEDASASFCALSCAEGLCRFSANHNAIVAHRLFMPLCCSLLRSCKLPRLHLVILSRLLFHVAQAICAVGDTEILRAVMRAAVARCRPPSSSSSLLSLIPGSHLSRDVAVSADAHIAPHLLGMLAVCVRSGAAVVGGLAIVAAHGLFNGFTSAGLDLTDALVNRIPTCVVAERTLLDGVFHTLKDAEFAAKATAIVEKLYRILVSGTSGVKGGEAMRTAFQEFCDGEKKKASYLNAPRVDGMDMAIDMNIGMNMDIGVNMNLAMNMGIGMNVGTSVGTRTGMPHVVAENVTPTVDISSLPMEVGMEMIDMDTDMDMEGDTKRTNGQSASNNDSTCNNQNITNKTTGTEGRDNNEAHNSTDNSRRAKENSGTGTVADEGAHEGAGEAKNAGSGAAGANRVTTAPSGTCDFDEVMSMLDDAVMHRQGHNNKDSVNMESEQTAEQQPQQQPKVQLLDHVQEGNESQADPNELDVE